MDEDTLGVIELFPLLIVITTVWTQVIPNFWTPSILRIPPLFYLPPVLNVIKEKLCKVSPHIWKKY
jgi:hypothetical protein